MIITFHIQYIHIVISGTRDSHTHTPHRCARRFDTFSAYDFSNWNTLARFFSLSFFFIFTKDLRLWSFSDDFIFLGNSCSVLAVIL